MDMQRAKELLTILADGTDPLTGEVLPDDHVCNKGEIVRALNCAVEELSLSARAYDRILKVARTIADLEGNPEIQDSHLYEAVQYRAFEHSLRE